MNSVEILNCLKNNICTINKFSYGVFASNELPKHTKFMKPAFFVVNIDTSDKPGSHWIAMFFSKENKAEYFDSYGLPPRPVFTKYLKKNSNNFTYNKKRIQGDFSTNCGNYCCVYLCFKCNRKTLQNFTKCFSEKNYNFNDEKIIKMFNTLYIDKRFDEKLLNNQTCVNNVNQKV